MNRYNILDKVLHRVKNFTKGSGYFIESKINYTRSRLDAHKWRKLHIKKNKRQVVDASLKRQIKNYCANRFGSAVYWPWIALYTEIRGEFKEGWIPYDYYRFKVVNKLNIDTFSRLSGIKTFDFRLFDRKVIEPEAVCLNNRTYQPDGTVISKDTLVKRLKALNCELVIKPDDGSGGKNIQFVHSKNITKNHFPVAESIVIQKALNQHYLLEKVNPSSINTFRVLSFINTEGKVEIKFVFLRFGVAGSRLDNISKGGGWVFIFPNGRADDYSYNLEGFELVQKHPDTGVKFSTLSFPVYDKVVQLCKECHRKIPYAAFIGWDVFITEGGEAKLIEWNAKNPFFWPVEARYGPFFKQKDSI